MVLVIEMGGRRRGIGADCARGTFHSALHDTEGPGLGRTHATIKSGRRKEASPFACPLAEADHYQCGADQRVTFIDIQMWPAEISGLPPSAPFSVSYCRSGPIRAALYCT